MIKPYTRWTVDTETAFIMALKLTGQVRKAADAIGRQVGSAYSRRKRHPLFAARWDAVVAEQQFEWIAAKGEAVVKSDTRERLDGWNAVRQRAFLRALSETGTVKAASERVMISADAVYKLRKRSPGFARDFERALARSAPMLEQVAWERAVEGWDEPIVVKGEVVGTRRRYSETLLRTLLTTELVTRRAERVAAAKVAPKVERATEAETNARLKALLDGLAKRVKAKDREKALARAQGEVIEDDEALVDG